MKLCESINFKSEEVFYSNSGRDDWSVSG